VRPSPSFQRHNIQRDQATGHNSMIRKLIGLNA